LKKVFNARRKVFTSSGELIKFTFIALPSVGGKRERKKKHFVAFLSQLCNRNSKNSWYNITLIAIVDMCVENKKQHMW
jgi:hypothetical protein